jgi:chromate transporter
MSSHLPPVSESPSSWSLLRVWLGLGLHSFGGGAATLYLIRRAAVERQGWLSDAEFARDWAICQIAPGINLLALTILLGRRVAGARGIALALLGLLLPSVAITIVATAFYARVREAPVMRAALRGVLPATVGLGLLMATQLARPLLRDSRSEGRASLLWSGLLLAGSAAAFALWHPPVILILCAAGALGAAWEWRRHTRAPLR